MHPGVYRIGSNLFGAVCVTSGNIIMRSNIKDNWIKHSIYSAAIIGYIFFYESIFTRDILSMILNCISRQSMTKRIYSP
jgi:hypothetical protein